MPDTYYESQLTGEQIENVLENPVLTVSQSLNSVQKSIARNNIGAAAEADIITDYDDLTDKPQINGFTLSGNKTASALGIGTPFYYGTCSTATLTTEKAVSISGITALSEGLSIRVLFENHSSLLNSAKLNVNNLGAKSITGGNTVWSDNETLDFVYDGTAWKIVNHCTADTSNYGIVRLSSSATDDSQANAANSSAINQLWLNLISNYDKYSAYETYSVGDRVRKDYNIWECNTNISSAETWTEAHWTKIDTLIDLIDSNTEAISEKGIPSGGSSGQVLKKNSSQDYDVYWANESGGGGGTSDYLDLNNKPQINSITLTGNKSASDLGLGTYTKPSGGIPDTDLSSSVQASLAKADTALQTAPVSSVDGKTGTVTVLPSGGTSGQVLKKNSSTDYDVFWGNESGGGGGGTSDYSDLTNKPQINSVTLSGNLSASDLGLGTYSKPSGGIPDTDLSSGVQVSLDLADTAYQKPSSGIPASDLASGVIPTAYASNPSMDGTASPGSTGYFADGGHVHPSDTSKQNIITVTGILKGDGSGGVSAAVAGTDYQAVLSDYQKSWFGTSVTDADVQAKTALVDGLTSLGYANAGVVIDIYFSKGNSIAEPTLNINSLGAFGIYETSASGNAVKARAYAWAPGTVLSFSFDGSKWIIVGRNTASTTYYGITKLYDGTDSTSTELAATANAVKIAKDAADAASVGLSGKANSDLGISNAVVNQYVQITAVDGNGKPTAFGAATPSGGGSAVNVASVTIAYANWTGSGPYTQTVTISGATITSDTKVDLQPDATAIAQLFADSVTALYISNTSGTLTAYAIGAATTADLTIQCTYYETV